MIWLWLLIAGVVAFLVHQLWYKRLKYPAGPMPWPIFGHGLEIYRCERWEDRLLEWKKQYGSIYTYWLGPIPVITVNDYKTAVEMFVKDGESYSDRYIMMQIIYKMRGGVFGILDTNGDEWRVQRRFALKVLRDFGLGKNVMQDRILEEVQTICENVNKELDEIGDGEIDMQKHTNLAIGSIINNVICGYRFSTNGREQEYYRIKELFNRLVNPKLNPLLLIAGIAEVCKINIPPLKRYHERSLEEFREIFNFVNKSADEHLANTDYSQLVEPRDFIDAYIMAGIQSEQEDGKNEHYTRNHLRNTGADIWAAGMETTANTVHWAIAYLIVYSDEQRKLQEELDNIVGSDRLITLADRQNLPFSCAVVTEVQRCANILSQNLLRMTSRDVVINGKHIPKGTVCVPQMSTIMMDGTVFKDPKRFNPSRFIDSNGQFKPNDEVIPFSIGKRACMGEALARMELFLIIINLFNQYKFFAGNSPPILQRYPNGGSPNLKPYVCRIQRRF
ncbi:(pine wood nematode) hypothetical protein [Aphelenchoides bicaudatus]|nr:(pine wood nematode) hypothetical protein [Aphelenchoides bicaudatus]